MDLTSMLNKKRGSVAQQQLPGLSADYQFHNLPLVKSEPDMERSVSPHMSEHSSYSTPHSMSRSYGSPSAMQASIHMPGSMPNTLTMATYPEMPPGMGNVQNMAVQSMPQQAAPPAPPPPPPVKAYPCSTCGKAFARRSDLARHVRIHTGVRPHVCDYPTCGKEFIQRSALTVHQRVHTGEKPHHCETCAKRFSDSSSLARHRRTHTGNRPYKCPYADCQKTFTRRTTLTRHQNHHSGTIEEAAVATAAALAASKVKNASMARSEGDHMSSHGSPMTTPSPAHRTMSMSPHMDMSGPNSMHRHAGDFQFMQQGGQLPPHLRVGSPTSQSSNGYSNNNGIRPTSHPTSYGPPPTLEPSLDQHQSGSASNGGSPHMGNVGWQSPSHVPSSSHPHHQNGAGYVYPEPDTYPQNTAMGQMYYSAGPQLRRPQNTESGMVHMT